MLIPYNTDAPIYYFPFTTIALIAANVAMYIATTFLVSEGDAASVLWMTLEFDKINPVQWLTNNFLHAGLLHLLGNMFFLWALGLVVEGKLGWWRFLMLYLGIGVTYGALVQTTMYLVTVEYGLALGASGVIFGILAVAVLWAPQNNMECLLVWRFIPQIVEIPIFGFGFFYLVIQVLFFVFRQYQMSSEALHLTGLAVGLPVGVMMLKLGWVDCEGQDYFSIYHPKGGMKRQLHAKRGDQRRAAAADAENTAQEARDLERKQLVRSLAAALDAGKNQAACALYARFAGELRNGQHLPDQQLPKLISAMHQQKNWETSIPLLVELLRRHPPVRTVAARLKLAQILLQVTEQPKQAVAVLKKLPPALDAKQKQRRDQLAKLAKKLLADGSFEVEVKDW